MKFGWYHILFVLGWVFGGNFSLVLEATATPRLGNHLYLPVIATDPSAVAAYQLLLLSDQAGEMQVYTMRANGENLLRLSTLPAKAPQWSPDGNQVLFSSPTDAGEDLYVVQSDGSALRALTTMQGNEYDAAWSPDGKSVLFLHAPPAQNLIELYTIALDATTPRLLAANPSLHTPLWSPDGLVIVYTADEAPYDAEPLRYQLFRVTNDAIPPQQLTFGEVGYQLEGWIESGKRLLIREDYPDDRLDLYTLQSDGALLQRFSSTTGTETVAAISADGQQIVYSVTHLNSTAAQLYDHTTNQSAAEPLSAPYCHTPTCGLQKATFAPDGLQVAYVIWEAISINFSPSQLWIATTANGDPAWRPTLTEVYSPVWVNASTLIVHRNEAGSSAYTRTPYLYNIDRNTEIPLMAAGQDYTTVYAARRIP